MYSDSEPELTSSDIEDPEVHNHHQQPNDKSQIVNPPKKFEPSKTLLIPKETYIIARCYGKRMVKKLLALVTDISLCDQDIVGVRFMKREKDNVFSIPNNLEYPVDFEDIIGICENPIVKVVNRKTIYEFLNDFTAVSDLF